jgi:hypothetical protein
MQGLLSMSSINVATSYVNPLIFHFFSTDTFSDVQTPKQYIETKKPPASRTFGLTSSSPARWLVGPLIGRGVRGPAACEYAHLFTLHPAPEPDYASVLSVCVPMPLRYLCNCYLLLTAFPSSTLLYTITVRQYR